MAIQLKKRNIDVHLLCSPNSQLSKEAVKNNLVIHPIMNTIIIFTRIKYLNIVKLHQNERFGHYTLCRYKDLWLIVPAYVLADQDTPLIISKQVGSSIIKKDFLHRFYIKE